MQTTNYQIDAIDLDDLVKICKRDGNTPIYIESELGKILTLSSNLRSLIKLYKIQYFLIENKNITKDNSDHYYNFILSNLIAVGYENKELREASLPLKSFLEKLKEEKVTF